ncbi:hypothetical protein V5O48_013832 [Marasmius crinis-equi]|uniref:Nephrocystin 3-like N-terminal domain-containing protein n=1 Tax=Marasmius crinis-equi TaxID=585013 RepID=A0ABR3EZ06_9AGAR
MHLRAEGFAERGGVGEVSSRAGIGPTGRQKNGPSFVLTTPPSPLFLKSEQQPLLPRTTTALATNNSLKASLVRPQYSVLRVLLLAVTAPRLAQGFWVGNFSPLGDIILDTQKAGPGLGHYGGHILNANYGGDQNIHTGSGTINTRTRYNVAGDLVQSFTSAVSNREFELFFSTSASENPLPKAHKTLWDAVVGVKASHNSDLQFARGDCLPGTREAILEDIHEWRRPEDGGPPVCWLSGPMGVGKSAVALTIARACAKRGGLAGSFFFFRLDPRRDNPSALIPTIAHGLVVTRPRTGRLINRRITADPRILEASLEEQYTELIINPLTEKKGRWTWLKELWAWLRNPSAPASPPNLVIIDGLDECRGNDDQIRILSILFSSIKQSPCVPLQFLICSRPEAWIRETFDSPQYRHLTKRVVLENSISAREDIKLYFLRCFREIRESPKYAEVEFPDPWPALYVLEILVEKASAQFVYAVTVIRFIGDGFAHPFEQLRIILDAPRPHPSKPFQELDVLYHIVLSANPDHVKLFPLLAAIIVLPRHASPAFLEMLFELAPGTVSLTLRPMHSVLNIRGRDDPIAIYHTSFSDFLEDESRSESFFVHRSFQRNSFLRRWGRVIVQSMRDKNSSKNRPDGKFPWTAWADCCLENPSEEVLQDLDDFYTTILFECSHHNEVVSILAAVVLSPTSTPKYIRLLHGYTVDQVALALQEMDWVLLSRGPEDKLTVTHASFVEFLLDQSRSRQFFVDRSNARHNYFVRWLRIHYITPNSNAELDLRPWYKFCSHLKIPKDVISSALLDFYSEIWDIFLRSSSLRSIVATLATLSRHTGQPPSMKLVALLQDLQNPEAHYYLRIGRPARGPNYPSFLDFLKEKSCSVDFSVLSGDYESLACRWIEILVKLCQGPDERLILSPSSPQRVLWDGWADLTCVVDQPSEDLLDILQTLASNLGTMVTASARICDRAEIPARPAARLREYFCPHRPLFSRFENVLRWLKLKGVIDRRPALIREFETIQTQFHLGFCRSIDAQAYALRAVLDIVDCKYSLPSFVNAQPERSDPDYADRLSRCRCLTCPSDSEPSSVRPVGEGYHVDIQTECVRIARILAEDLKSAIHLKARGSVVSTSVVLNVLDSSLLPRCGPKPDILPFYREVLEAAKHERLRPDLVSEYHKSRLIVWLESFPTEYVEQINDLKTDFLALLSQAED